jgi:uncharacterized protein (DUF433 family)
MMKRRKMQMSRALDMLSVPEAAVVANVSVRDVNRVIDENILPDLFYRIDKIREFRSAACIFISFYFHTADRLTSEERQWTIQTASKLSHNWKLDRLWKIEEDWTVHHDFLTINLAPFCKTAHDRLVRLKAANDSVASDAEILSGTPVIKGTRIPVYDIGASVAKGIPMKRILAAYPSLDEERVNLAALYVEANPWKGRPRPSPLLKPGSTIISSRRVTLSRKDS